jgi:hypothetical protein
MGDTLKNAKNFIDRIGIKNTTLEILPVLRG